MSKGNTLIARLGVLEAESAVRRVLARYFQYCDDLGPHTPLEALGDLFTQEALWEGKGRYEEAFGRYVGRAAIVDMIGSYCTPPHFAMTAHFTSSESITVDGTNARGAWMMLQCSTYQDSRSDLRSAALTVGFEREGATWRISHFRTTNVFSRHVDHWNDTKIIPVPDAVVQASRT
jgi:SnoaL-like domain